MSSIASFGAYAAFVKGREPQLPALPIQYADYAAWQREWLQGEVLERQLAYWKSQLAGVATLELPTDRPRPPVASHEGHISPLNCLRRWSGRSRSWAGAKAPRCS